MKIETFTWVDILTQKPPQKSGINKWQVSQPTLLYKGCSSIRRVVGVQGGWTRSNEVGSHHTSPELEIWIKLKSIRTEKRVRECQRDCERMRERGREDENHIIWWVCFRPKAVPLFELFLQFSFLFFLFLSTYLKHIFLFNLWSNFSRKIPT